METQHVLGYAAWTWICNIDVAMDTNKDRDFRMDIDIQYGHGHSMYWDMLHGHGLAA
jgi:hypothetical protein